MRSMQFFRDLPPTSRVYSSDGTTFGFRTGGSRQCKCEGCIGLALAVRWQDGKLTYPCTKGMKSHVTGAYQIDGGR